MPPMTPVDGLKLTPLGRFPVLDSDGVGKPVFVIVNVPAVPTLKVSLSALVIAGGVPSTTFTETRAVLEVEVPLLPR